MEEKHSSKKNNDLNHICVSQISISVPLDKKVAFPKEYATNLLMNKLGAFR